MRSWLALVQEEAKVHVDQTIRTIRCVYDVDAEASHDAMHHCENIDPALCCCMRMISVRRRAALL